MSKASTVSLPVLENGAESASDDAEKVRLPLLDQFLKEQQELTAVERFSQLHDEVQFPLQEQYYRSLLPSARPAEGQQYRFEVDLDRCTGCKACVTACHSLNGLEEDETWRQVGMLHGGSTIAPLQQTVTTACHHCLDPACMNGCPVKAYEKDPTTGIVRHLDDQCIGCQYCTFTCPYEVPQYSKRKGIVRKCDMCADRLAEGEAPACVQACPNEAIAIGIVDAQQVLEDAQGDAFLPGAPSPGITAPTTLYHSKRPLPRNMLPADFYNVRPQHQHLPLVLMLVLTQLSIGAFSVEWLLGFVLDAATLSLVRPLHATVALGLGFLALGASTLHLGRPQYAFRAIMGIRTSWMSREIVALGGFAGLAAIYAGSIWQQGHPSPLAALPELPALASRVADQLGVAVVVAGLFGIFCSAMLYHATGKLWWTMSRTGFRFFMTAAVLGLATTLVTTTVAAVVFGGGTLTPALTAMVRALAEALMGATTVKLLGEALVFHHLRDKQHGDLKRSARLMVGALRKPTFFRFTLGVIGGLLVPGAFLMPATAGTSMAVVTSAVVGLVFLMAGELLERGLFFAALSAPRMPGGKA